MQSTLNSQIAGPVPLKLLWQVPSLTGLVPLGRLSQEPKPAPRELPESPWSSRFEVGRLGFAFHHLPWRGQAALLEETSKLGGEYPFVLFLSGSWNRRRKWAAASPPKSRQQPNRSNSFGLLPISVFTATRSPLPLGISPVG